MNQERGAGLITERKRWEWLVCAVPRPQKSLIVMEGMKVRLKKFFPEVVRRRGNYDMGDGQQSSQDLAAPRDRFHLVYLCFLMAGVGFLIPWFSFISAIDYFFYYYVEEFPSVSVVIPVGYLVTTFLSSTLNLYLVKVFGVHSRIRFGYLMFTISLLTIPLLDVGIHRCAIPTSVSFYVTLLAIAVVGLGSGVQQSSYYGLSSMLPKKYTQAVMAGESVAGVIEITFRIITKAGVNSARTGAIVFFSLSLFFMVICFLCHCYIRASKMVKFYTTQCQAQGVGGARTEIKTGEREEVEERDVEVEGMSDEFELENADNQQLLSTNSCQVSESEGEDEVLRTMDSKKMNGGTSEHSKKRLSISMKLPFRRAHWEAFVRVVRQIWALIGAIFMVTFVTLLLFPGLLSEVQNCSLGSWSPILTIAIFNFIDFVAKWLALLPLRWSPWQLLVISILRIILIPLIILCVSPSPTYPVLGSYSIVWAGIFSLILGLSNGYFISLLFISVSSHVEDKKDRELAGIVMTWVLLMGLLLGAVCAYAVSPLTTLADHTVCSNSTTEVFSLCSHGNITVT